MRIEYNSFYESIQLANRRHSFEKKKSIFVDRNMTYVSMSVLLQFWEQLNKNSTFRECVMQ